MTEFIAALVNPDIPFLRYALLAGVLASVSFGTIGTLVVVHRITYMAGAIAHSVLGGIGLSLYLQATRGWTWCTPILGAIVTALVAALIIGWVSLRGSQRPDTVIGAIWAVGMAVGVLFLALTPGYVDPMSYLFGDILLVTRWDLILILALDVIVLGLIVCFFNQLAAVCFDEEYARVLGLPVTAFFLGLLCLTALVVVLMVRIVGIVMVIAMLTLPAASAGRFASRLWHMMLGAALLSMVFVVAGLAVSYSSNLPSGATMIVIAGASYFLLVPLKRRTTRRRAASGQGSMPAGS